MKNSEPSLTLTAGVPGYGGISISRHDGKVVLLEGALPGEIVRAEVTEDRKDYLRAMTLEVLEPSPDRVSPRCRFFGACGGCHLQYVSGRRQVSIKEQVLTDCLSRTAKLELSLSPSLTHDNPWQYRHRGQFKVVAGNTGFYRKATRDIIPVDSCPVITDEVNGFLRKAVPILERIEACEAHISCGNTAVILIKVPSGGVRFLRPAPLAQEFLDAGFAGGVIMVPGQQPMGFGDDHTSFDLNGLKYTVSPAGFFQTHWELNRKLVGALLESPRPLDGLRVLDLYAGAGNFSIPAALEAAEVTAVEEGSFALEDASRNLKLNNVKNCRFVRGQAERFTPQGHYDVVIVDPPRPGLTNRTVETLLQMRPARVAYISCNPSTLARDLKKLSSAYDVQSVSMVDFFPQTYHIESLTLLKVK